MSVVGSSHYLPKSLIVLAATLALANASGGSASASSEQMPSGRIVFARGDHLYVTSTDGREVTRLTRNATQPAVSRDGERIAFVRAKSIWVMQRDGSEQTRLTSGHEDWTPAWSPDASTIYFGRLAEGKDKYGGYEFASALFRMGSNGSGLRQLTRPPASSHGVCDESPSVSPDGRVIAFASILECDRGNDPLISAIDPTGRPVSLRAYDDVRDGFDPEWAPAGKRIAFAITGEFGQSTGISIAAPGSQAKRVYKRAASDPAWSPDGAWVAFVRGVGEGTIWLVRPDGSGLRRVSSRRYDADPAWLPATR